MGLDRSMILGHGQDDRVCAYPSLRAQINVANVERTSITLIVDKEEIGSVGASGMTSRFFENTIAEIMALAGEGSPLACAARSPAAACFPLTCPPASTRLRRQVRDQERGLYGSRPVL